MTTSNQVSAAHRPALAVQCTGITKWFGEGDARTQALRGIDLDIQLGQMTLVSGESGCGKTTLISIIAGLLDATEGKMQVLGTTAADLKPEEAILFRRKNLGFVFQAFNLLPALTAAENAAMPLFVAGQPWNVAVEQSSALLAELGMGDRLHSLPRKLSGGQQQRVALARALVHSPRMIICDEPTSALDAKSGQKVMELLSTAAVRPDRAVIVVTHDSRVFEFGDRIVTMEDGRVISNQAGMGKAQQFAQKQHHEGNERGQHA